MKQDVNIFASYLLIKALSPVTEMGPRQNEGEIGFTEGAELKTNNYYGWMYKTLDVKLWNKWSVERIRRTCVAKLWLEYCRLVLWTVTDKFTNNDVIMCFRVVLLSSFLELYGL